MLQRTGRGARAYYRLNSQYRVARPEVEVEPTLEQPPAPEAVAAIEETVQSAPRRRRARQYGQVAPVTTATDTPSDDITVPSAPDVVEGEGAIPVAAAVDVEADQATAEEDEQAMTPSKSARRRSRRKAASQAAADVDQEPVVEEQPATPAKTTQRRTRRKSASQPQEDTPGTTDDQPQPVAAEQAAPDVQPEVVEAPRKRRRRKKTTTEGTESSEG
jgi:hypothetical protein